MSLDEILAGDIDELGEILKTNLRDLSNEVLFEEISYY